MRWLRAAVELACVTALTVALGLTAWTVLPLAVGWQPSVVLTGSMAPALMPGDVVVTDPAAAREAQPGHVIVFDDPARPGRAVVHRVVREAEHGALVTRGDANAVADSTPVPRAAVEGLARLRVPAVGLPLLWWHEGRWLPLGGALVGLAVASLVTGAMLLPPHERGRRRAPGRAVGPRRRRTPVRPCAAAVLALLVGSGSHVALLGAGADATYTAATSNGPQALGTLVDYPGYRETVTSPTAPAHFHWLDEATSGTDVVAANAGTGAAGVYRGTAGLAASVAGAITGEPENRAVHLPAGAYGVATTASSLTTNAPFTVVVWFRATSAGPLMNLSTTTSGSGDPRSAPRLYINSTGFLCGAALEVARTIPSNNCGSTVVTDGAWHHAALTYTPGAAEQMRVYLDGSLRNAWSLDHANVSGHWRVGTDPIDDGNAPDTFTGALDEAAVYATALSQTQLAAQYAARTGTGYASTVQVPGLLHWWRLTDAAANGVTMTDAVGTNHGTWRGFPVVDFTLGVPGALAGAASPGTAVRLHGTSWIGSAQDTTAATRFSVAAWVRTTAASGPIVTYSASSAAPGATAPSRAVYLRGGRVVFGTVAPDGTTRRTITGPDAVHDGAWHLVVATLGVGGMRLYVDGRLVASDPGATSTTTTAGYWRWGGDAMGAWDATVSTYLVGELDEVSAHPGAELTAQDVAWYAGARGR